jgi:hypothetical protein
MTNANGAPKFEAALKEIGASYEIKASIVGQEKVDFIKSARVFYMPSKSESYGFALMEALGHCDCFVLSDYEWWGNFDRSLLHVSDKSHIADEILNCYNKPSKLYVKGLEYIKTLDKECDDIWETKISSFKGRQSKAQSATIVGKDDVFYRDYIQSLNRFASVEDIISVLGNKHKFNVLYNKTDTYLTTKGTQIPDRTTKAGLDDLF